MTFINGICGVLYIGVGVVLAALSVSDVWPWNLGLGFAATTNLLCGARLLSRAYREAYQERA